MIIRLLLSALAVLILAEVLPGVSVRNYFTAIIVAIVLSLLQITVKPVLKLLSLPITILTFGLFLFVINAIIILLADFFIDGFVVGGFFSALIFSLLLGFLQSILYSFLDKS